MGHVKIINDICIMIGEFGADKEWSDGPIKDLNKGDIQLLTIKRVLMHVRGEEIKNFYFFLYP